MSIFGVEKTAESTFQLKFVWGSDTLAFAVDQVLGRGNSSPLTDSLPQMKSRTVKTVKDSQE